MIGVLIAFIAGVVVGVVGLFIGLQWGLYGHD